jgi:elongation factor Ts
MANVSAQMVKELREMTGAGMMECKKALVEAEADMDKAVDVLRTRGLAAAAKKAGRETKEGRVVALLSADEKAGVLVEVNCETDFVSSNEVFEGYCNKVAKAVLENDPADIDALKECSVDGEKVADIITEAIHKIGENIQIKRFIRHSADAGCFATYIHGAGKIGILAQFAFENAATAAAEEFKTMARDVCLQAAAMNPGAVDRNSFDQAVIDHEMGIYKQQAAESGKPENIQEKIATGRMEKFYKESALVEQEFVKDSDKTVKQYIDSVAKKLGDKISVVAFERFELGK